MLATSRKWEINHDNKFDCWFLFDCTLKHFIYDWVFLIKWSMGLGMINYILKIKKDATRMITVELSALVVFIFSFSSNLDIIMDNNRYHKNNSYFCSNFEEPNLIYNLCEFNFLCEITIFYWKFWHNFSWCKGLTDTIIVDWIPSSEIYFCFLQFCYNGKIIGKQLEFDVLEQCWYVKWVNILQMN